ncbi:hypothetical protein N3K66_005539 [Trichothecium roseum]|uniref:Uncharacterized protein n=1 Tax=Trichothecium roseum TaxID=47278 RepID=A0ACC0UY58_9HYPO|nr:hypothetical protein N3K66_005539 [Trichothecium roseum]
MGLAVNVGESQSSSGSVSSWLYAALLLLACVAVVKQVHQWYRLRHIPGPRWAGWTPWWQLSRALSGQYHEKLKEVSDQYGPLVRIGPNQLLCTDPDVLRRMSSVRSMYTKGDFYDSGRIIPGVDNVVSMRDEDEHKAMRGRMWAAYVGKENEGFSFEPGMDRQLLAFVDLLKRKYVSTDWQTRPVDLAEKTQFFALDAIGDVSMGAPFGYLAYDEDLYQYNEINESSLPVMNMVSVLPWLTKIVHKWPLRLLLPKEGDQVGFGRLMSLATRYVDSRLEPGAAPVQDMMQAHINNGMDRNELIQQVLIFLIAGSNSTAHALRMTLLSLITSPTAYTSLVSEIAAASGSGKASSPITWAESQVLPYLGAVVKEGMRMWPPVAGLGFKRVPVNGDSIGGYFIPGGTEIGQGFHGVGRSKAVWGDDADVFRPERWLGRGDEELRRMTAAVDTHFGHGKYSCLGKPIAMMELHKAVFELLRHFDISLINPECPIRIKASVFFRETRPRKRLYYAFVSFVPH